MLRARSSALAVGALLVLSAFFLAPDRLSGASGELQSIQLYPDRASIFPGGAFGFGAIGTYSDGRRLGITRKVKFQSVPPSVAPFVRKNAVLGGMTGDASITASWREIVSPPIRFFVSDIASLSIEPAENGIRLGSRVRFAARATLANGASGLIATGLVDWESDHPQNVPIENRRNKKAFARGLQPEPAIITARFNADIVASKEIRVVEHLESVKVTPSERVVQLRDGGRFRAIGTFEDGVEADISLDVSWSVVDPSIAKLDRSGRVKTKAVGQTPVRAVDRDTPDAPTQEALLIVVGDLETLTVEPAKLALPVGGEALLDALATFDPAPSPSTFSWGARVIWGSTDNAVASVDDDGNVLCVAEGAARIFAIDPKSGQASTELGIPDNGQVTCSQP